MKSEYKQQIKKERQKKQSHIAKRNQNQTYKRSIKRILFYLLKLRNNRGESVNTDGNRKMYGIWKVERERQTDKEERKREREKSS